MELSTFQWTGMAIIGHFLSLGIRTETHYTPNDIAKRILSFFEQRPLAECYRCTYAGHPVTVYRDGSYEC